MKRLSFCLSDENVIRRFFVWVVLPVVFEEASAQLFEGCIVFVVGDFVEGRAQLFVIVVNSYWVKMVSGFLSACMNTRVSGSCYILELDAVRLSS